jgi:hypothetical protein
VSKHGSKEKIGQSIDGILGNLTIRGRESEKDKELEQLRKKVAAYESLGSLEQLNREKEDLIKCISDLKEEYQAIQNSQAALRLFNEDMSLTERDKSAYRPTEIISQYCEQAEGKRKLTIHLREIEYQAILSASKHFYSSKGQLMDTITKALRFYIPNSYYLEAERQVALKAVHSVQGMLKDLGFSPEEVDHKLKRE